MSSVVIVNEDGTVDFAPCALSIPIIASVKDLPLGIRYGNQVPDARWYVVKRAKALGEAKRLPLEWSQS